jgi:hypothetical protein
MCSGSASESAWSRSVSKSRIGGNGPVVKGKDPGRWLGLRRDPYHAGGPARTWHLADLASVGCRGVNGPVPQPSLDTCSSVVRGCYGLRWAAVKADESRHRCRDRKPAIADSCQMLATRSSDRRRTQARRSTMHCYAAPRTPAAWARPPTRSCGITMQQVGTSPCRLLASRAFDRNRLFRPTAGAGWPERGPSAA